MRFFRLVATALLPLFAASCLFAESVAGLTWTPPKGWTSQGATGMRAATYVVTSGHANAECAVYFFGPNGGGSIDANIERWKGQFVGPDGKPSPATVSKENVNGLNVTFIESQGTYTGMGGPMAAPSTMQDYRLLGAIVAGPGGNVFVKFTGPAKLVSANRAKVLQMVHTFQKRP